MPEYKPLEQRVEDGFFAGIGNSFSGFYKGYIAPVGHFVSDVARAGTKPVLYAGIALVLVAGCARGGEIGNNPGAPSAVEAPVGETPKVEDKRTKEELINSLFSHYREQYGKYYEQMSRDNLAALVSDKDTGYYIVQFNDKLKKEWWQEIEALGGEGIGLAYGGNALGVKIDPSKKNQIEALPYVRWVGIYQPIYRLSPIVLQQLSEATDSTKVKVEVHVFENFNEIKDNMQRLGIDIVDKTSSSLIINTTKSKLMAILLNPSIKYVEEYTEYKGERNLK